MNTIDESSSLRAYGSHVMRGLGRIFRCGRVWWVAFYYYGREIRESTRLENEVKARRLLKQRLVETQTGRFIVDEEKLTFEDVAEGLIVDYKLNERKSLKTAVFNNVNHLRAFFGFDRVVDIVLDRIRAYQLTKQEQ